MDDQEFETLLASWGVQRGPVYSSDDDEDYDDELSSPVITALRSIYDSDTSPEHGNAKMIIINVWVSCARTFYMPSDIKRCNQVRKRLFQDIASAIQCFEEDHILQDYMEILAEKPKVRHYSSAMTQVDCLIQLIPLFQVIHSKYQKKIWQELFNILPSIFLERGYVNFMHVSANGFTCCWKNIQREYQKPMLNLLMRFFTNIEITDDMIRGVKGILNLILDPPQSYSTELVETWQKQYDSALHQHIERVDVILTMLAQPACLINSSDIKTLHELFHYANMHQINATDLRDYFQTIESMLLPDYSAIQVSVVENIIQRELRWGFVLFSRISKDHFKESLAFLLRVNTLAKQMQGSNTDLINLFFNLGERMSVDREGRFFTNWPYQKAKLVRIFDLLEACYEAGFRLRDDTLEKLEWGRVVKSFRRWGNSEALLQTMSLEFLRTANAQVNSNIALFINIVLPLYFLIQETVNFPWGNIQYLATKYRNSSDDFPHDALYQVLSQAPAIFFFGKKRFREVLPVFLDNSDTSDYVVLFTSELGTESFLMSKKFLSYKKNVALYCKESKTSSHRSLSPRDPILQALGYREFRFFLVLLKRTPAAKRTFFLDIVHSHLLSSKCLGGGVLEKIWRYAMQLYLPLEKERLQLLSSGSRMLVKNTYPRLFLKHDTHFANKLFSVFDGVLVNFFEVDDEARQYLMNFPMPINSVLIDKFLEIEETISEGPIHFNRALRDQLTQQQLQFNLRRILFLLAPHVIHPLTLELSLDRCIEVSRVLPFQNPLIHFIKLNERWPFLSMDRSFDLHAILLQNANEFVFLYQAAFEKITSFTFFTIDKEVKGATKIQMGDDIFRSACEMGILTHEGHIAHNVLDLMATVGDDFPQGKIYTSLEKGWKRWLETLSFFQDYLASLCLPDNKESLRSFLDAFLKLSQLIFENPYIQSDYPFFRKEYLPKARVFNSEYEQALLDYLREHGFLDDQDRIISRDCDRLKAQLSLDYQSRVKDWKKVPSGPDDSSIDQSLINDLLSLFIKSLTDMDPLKQLFEFIPKMNPYWLSNLMEYFQLLLTVLPPIQSSTALHQLYLLLQISPARDPELLIVLAHTNSEDFKQEDNPSLALMLGQYFRQRDCRARCKKILFDDAADQELRKLAIEAIASIALDLIDDEEEENIILSRLYALLQDTTLRSDIVAVTIYAISRINQDPFSATFKKLLFARLLSTAEKAENLRLLHEALKALHLLVFTQEEDALLLEQLSMLRYQDRELRVALAIVQSDLPHLPSLIHAWEMISSSDWPYPANLPHDIVGTPASFNQFCRQPVELERSRYALAWKIRGNLTLLEKVPCPKDLPWNFTLLDALPESSRFNVLPFKYPEGHLLFRGIGTADGKKQSFLALLDLIRQGSAGADLTHASVYGQTNSKNEMLFATSSLKIAMDKRYFSMEDGFLIVIDTAYFNAMMHKGEYRIEREVDYNIVLYNRIPLIGILAIFAPNRFASDLEKLHQCRSVVDFRQEAKSDEFQKLDESTLREIKYALSKKQRHSLASSESTVLFDKFEFFPAELTVEQASAYVVNTLKDKQLLTLKNVLARSEGIERDLNLFPDPKLMRSMIEYHYQANCLWDQYHREFFKVPFSTYLQNPSDQEFMTQFDKISEGLPADIRALVYSENIFTRDLPIDFFSPEYPKFSSYWELLHELFDPQHEKRLRSDRVVETRSLPDPFIVRSTAILFLYAASQWQGEILKSINPGVIISLKMVTLLLEKFQHFFDLDEAQLHKVSLYVFSSISLIVRLQSSVESDLRVFDVCFGTPEESEFAMHNLFFSTCRSVRLEKTLLSSSRSYRDFLLSHTQLTS